MADFLEDEAVESEDEELSGASTYLFYSPVRLRIRLNFGRIRHYRVKLCW